MNPTCVQGGWGLGPTSNSSFTAQPSWFYPPGIMDAVNALTPGLAPVHHEHVTRSGADAKMAFGNLLPLVCFAAAGNARVRNPLTGEVMPLVIHVRPIGPKYSGKTVSHDRYLKPVNTAMKGWLQPWKFANATPAKLHRDLRGGAVFGMLVMDEGRKFLKETLSREFDLFSSLFVGSIPPFGRSSDKAGETNHDYAILGSLVNVQNGHHRDWLKAHGKEALEQGYLLRLLMVETDATAVPGAGMDYPEVALLKYDARMIELVTAGRKNADKGIPDSLPILDVSPVGKEFLRRLRQRYTALVRSGNFPPDATALFFRLIEHILRIAGAMHVYEGSLGPIRTVMLKRATTIAEFFAGEWLRIVFLPEAPPPVPKLIVMAEQLDARLRQASRETGNTCWTEADVCLLGRSFGWSKGETDKAIRTLYEHGRAMPNRRSHNGRLVDVLDLLGSPLFPPAPMYFPPPPAYIPPPQKYVPLI